MNPAGMGDGEVVRGAQRAHGQAGHHGGRAEVWRVSIGARLTQRGVRFSDEAWRALVSAWRTR